MKTEAEAVPAPLRVAVAQIAIADGDVEANLDKVAQVLCEASARGADFLLLPELCLTGLVAGDALVGLAEPPGGPIQQAMRDLARHHGVATAFSYPERGENGAFHITTEVVDKSGTPVHVYRKIHLFSEENVWYQPGDALAPFSLWDWPSGLLTCYDVEFPEPARQLALAGCRLLFVNAANMEPYEGVHRTFVAARAMENQIYVVYCNRVGANARYRYRGNSLVLAPDGAVLLDLGLDQEAVQCVDLEWQAIVQARVAYDYLAERRLLRQDSAYARCGRTLGESQ
ncbi:carbon-nitrogen hydrolase family protein [Alicyclobacillus acidocaldarius]|uniref:Nitrilase/cyanide hydratase and apolipoprotein N-acyltransferase n=1 Tax=Alicyclobacillus acidocaldarius subsp. acidocaldarius (strain ATCC 27009 / DSM 446 / BCRC 14685 / JCM 5260 / KCTC 1825 / NBRC 15652 / NCIMB 11725 / NRRL B-14509 / 104-IA) TaxID=521098 RepID=C8WQE4_ALIAD|nr:carbon-nitrogen hydrolase family protein [Alicyclobacillus acidocaldarius]ACV59089.1 Nitrilase/cyanide hydratase and apolipoprotein N- acyltransferase [Alicyclobacillus acidocaldarius subsp. acidocaldarius DSM 446]